MEIGKLGESRVSAFLASKGYSLKFIGHSEENKQAPLDSPDFLVTGHVTGSKEKKLVGKTLEVKCDTRAADTGNACLELFSNVGSGRRGWVYTTLADYLGYLSAGDGRLIIVGMPEVRRIVETVRVCKDFFLGVNPLFTSLGLLVPIERLEKDALFHGFID